MQLGWDDLVCCARPLGAIGLIGSGKAAPFPFGHATLLTSLCNLRAAEPGIEARAAHTEPLRLTRPAGSQDAWKRRKTSDRVLREVGCDRFFGNGAPNSGLATSRRGFDLKLLWPFLCESSGRFRGASAYSQRSHLQSIFLHVVDRDPLGLR